MKDSLNKQAIVLIKPNGEVLNSIVSSSRLDHASHYRYLFETDKVFAEITRQYFKKRPINFYEEIDNKFENFLTKHNWIIMKSLAIYGETMEYPDFLFYAPPVPTMEQNAILEHLLKDLKTDNLEVNKTRRIYTAIESKLKEFKMNNGFAHNNESLSTYDDVIENLKEVNQNTTKKYAYKYNFLVVDQKGNSLYHHSDAFIIPNQTSPEITDINYYTKEGNLVLTENGIYYPESLSDAQKSVLKNLKKEWKKPYIEDNEEINAINHFEEKYVDYLANNEEQIHSRFH